MSQQKPVNASLEDWNRLEQEDAMRAILPCNGSKAWAIGMVNARSFETPDECFAASDVVWNGLSTKDRKEAFDSHPRIGEHKAKAATEQSLKWSAGEQSKAGRDASTQAALADANKEYERRFARIFIVCATGKTAAEMLAILRARLNNDAGTELKEASEQQRQITQLRLRKWLGVA